MDGMQRKKEWYKRARPPLLREKQTKGTHARISRTPQVRGSCREYGRERWAKELVLALLFFSSAFFVFGASISSKYFLSDQFSTIFKPNKGSVCKKLI
jgi:hypothetical protein